jgi:hypothetical protein
MPVDITGPNRLVEQRLRLERCKDVAAQRLVRAGMASAKVDDLAAVRCLGVRQDDEAVSAPHLVLCGRFGTLYLGQHPGAVGAVELGAQDPLLDLALHPPPSEPQLDGILKLAPRLLGAPDQRGRIQTRRAPPVTRPLGDAARNRMTCC